MRQIATAATCLLLAACVQAQTESTLFIKHAGDQPSIAGAPDNFTGRVRVDTTFRAEAPARVSGGVVTFEPGARTAWHTHPLGQTLLVMNGAGLVQRWGGPVQAIKVGDIVWIPPGIKHWHGAASSTGMSHVAITEQLDGKTVDWLEKVSDAQYSGSTTNEGQTR